MRYILALVAATVLILLIWALQWWLVMTSSAEIQKRQPQPAQAGTEVVPQETLDASDFGTEVPGNVLLKIALADALQHWCIVWMALILLGCIGIAALLPSTVEV